VTASFSNCRLALPFRVCLARLQVKEAPVSTLSRIKPRGAQRTKINVFWSAENCSC
jgi:hypothetical protein